MYGTVTKPSASSKAEGGDTRSSTTASTSSKAPLLSIDVPKNNNAMGDEIEQKAAYELEGKRSETIKIFLVLITIHVSIGVVAYHFLEGFTWIDSLYFVSVIMATVGYGDLYPTTSAGKLFSVFFILISIGFTFSCISFLVVQMIQSQMDRMVTQVNAAAKGSTEEELASLAGLTTKEKYTLYMNTGVFGLIMALSVFLFVVVDGMDVITACYFVVITSSTIGLGDITPKTPFMRGFAAVWILLMTIMLAKLVGDYTTAYSTLLERRSMHRILRGPLSRRAFSDIDKDKSGTIERFEYLSAMLVKLKKVDQHDIDLIMREFDAKDIDDDGTLTKAELGL
mmetsp:Transcript_10331/g.17716  ORF Transcript_10331/g.17716 Transcript_10331/m.17716 type:complete len:339 (-) Transcript_10331:119-1135(-)|eukprot:CAMPEP_0184693608 /NCGR_PEP_ID=MMETSP0313-20130426/1783_1 /TAXON_ID=2792 /ORGANISM="Porphyridium aerugineum, Strain SAG 1380-2" /LENGTH=338 /DNA_ID=CAMNT_0027151721 /DNA_START=57 /DNA_END=1073 /DNA_ORIENTATION=-